MKCFFVGVFFVFIGFFQSLPGSILAAESGDSVCEINLSKKLPMGEEGEFDVWLRFSWSQSTMQDTLTVSNSLWTKCYLWGEFPDWDEEFMGFSGLITSTYGIQIHAGKYLLPEDAPPFSLNPEEAIQWVSVENGQCDNHRGAAVLYEFDVYIDASLMNPTVSPSALGFFPSPTSPPQALFRIFPDDCGLLALWYPVGNNVIVAIQTPVANEHSSFGTIKAMFR